MMMKVVCNGADGDDNDGDADGGNDGGVGDGRRRADGGGRRGDGRLCAGGGGAIDVANAKKEAEESIENVCDQSDNVNDGDSGNDDVDEDDDAEDRRNGEYSISGDDNYAYKSGAGKLKRVKMMSISTLRR